MKIAIDIDDTLTNTRENQIKFWKEYYKNNPRDGYSETLPSNINDLTAEQYLCDFWDTYREELSFKSTYKENARETIIKLINDGHTLCIVTSRPKEKYENLKEKIEIALKNNNIPINTIYTNATDKGVFCKEHNFDLLIDDSINHITSANNQGLKTILFNNNKEYNGIQTTSWNEVYDIIKSAKI